MIIDRLSTLYDRTPPPPPQVAAEPAFGNSTGSGRHGQPAAIPAGTGTTAPYTHGCGKCGCREYTLTRHHLWQCSGCGKLYPFITGLEPYRPKLPVVSWLTPCALCSTPWLMQSAINQDHYFCPDCTPLPEEHWSTLVLAGKKPVFVRKSR